MVLGQLHFNDFGVPVDGPLGIQQLFGVAQPSHELSQGMLELAKGQERAFQLVLFNGEEEENRKRFVLTFSAFYHTFPPQQVVLKKTHYDF